MSISDRPGSPGIELEPTCSTARASGPIPACSNCDYILDRCSLNNWRPRAVCNACARGDCYEPLPPPDPFDGPF